MVIGGRSVSAQQRASLWAHEKLDRLVAVVSQCHTVNARVSARANEVVLAHSQAPCFCHAKESAQLANCKGNQPLSAVQQTLSQLAAHSVDGAAFPCERLGCQSVFPGFAHAQAVCRSNVRLRCAAMHDNHRVQWKC